MTHPSRQDDEDVRSHALSRAVCVVVQLVAVGRVWWKSFCRQLGVSARTPPRPTPVRRVSGDLADSTHQLVRDAVLLLLLSVATRVPSLISGDGETCEVRHHFADGSRQ